MKDSRQLMLDFKYSDMEQMQEVIISLTRSSDSEIVDIFINMLTSNINVEISSILKESIKKIGGSYVIKEMLRLLESEEAYIRSFAFEILMAVGNDNIDMIIEEVEHSDKNKKKFIVDILGHLANEKSIPALLKCLDDEDENIIQSTVEALGNIGDRSVVNNLIKIFPICNLWTKYAIFDAIHRIGDQRDISRMKNMLNDMEFNIYREFINSS